MQNVIGCSFIAYFQKLTFSKNLQKQKFFKVQNLIEIQLQ